MSDKRKKPRGQLGYLAIRGEGIESGFEPLDLPKTKEEIEEYIVRSALATAASLGANLYNLTSEPRRTREADFDFTISTNAGTEYLELTEIAPLEVTGGRYDGAPVSYHQGALAELVYKKLLDKSNKYGIERKERIHLLSYATDWRFQLSNGVLALLSYWSIRREHCFASIVYFIPESSDSGELTLIYPTRPDAFGNFDEDSVRNRLILRPDLTRPEVRANGSVELRLSWPPWRGG